MSFERPLLLVLLVVPLALAIWIWRRRSGRIMLPLDHVTGSRGRRWSFLINLFETWPAILLAVAVLILAGPQQYAEPRDERILTNIEFCVDVSGSMTAKFGEGSRYDASMEAINQFLDYRKGDAFGLTFFGNSVLHWCPLTNDVSAIRCATPFMRPEIAPPWFGGTEIGKALMSCKQVLADRQEGERMIVLISDGFSSDLGGGNDQNIAQQLSRENIALFPVIVGGIPVQGELTNIAGMTGGEAFEADDPGVLQTIFSRIDEMQKDKMRRTVSETVDWYYPFALAGLIATSVCLLGSLGLRYTPW